MDEEAIRWIGLPVMSGFELAWRIRENAQNNGTRLVALSRYGQDSDVRERRDYTVAPATTGSRGSSRVKMHPVSETLRAEI